MTDARTYFDDIVIPTIKDFENERASVRRAFLACVALFHTVDYLAAQPRSLNKGNLRREFRNESAEFAIVDRVAHAFKHLEAGCEAAPDNKPLHVRAVFSRPPSFVGVMVIGLSYLGDTRGGVEIWNERGSDLLHVVRGAVRVRLGPQQYLWQPSIAVGTPETFLGRPIVEAVDLPDIGAGTFPVLFGDFASAFRIYDRIALSLLRDPYWQATSGLTRFHARRRVGARVVRPEAVRKLKIST